MLNGEFVMLKMYLNFDDSLQIVGPYLLLFYGLCREYTSIESWSAVCAPNSANFSSIGRQRGRTWNEKLSTLYSTS
jgi:hypothetical protein